jgi:hypothetical protein
VPLSCSVLPRVRVARRIILPRCKSRSQSRRSKSSAPSLRLSLASATRCCSQSKRPRCRRARLAAHECLACACGNDASSCVCAPASNCMRQLGRVQSRIHMCVSFDAPIGAEQSGRGACTHGAEMTSVNSGMATTSISTHPRQPKRPTHSPTRVPTPPARARVRHGCKTKQRGRGAALCARRALAHHYVCVCVQR